MLARWKQEAHEFEASKIKKLNMRKHRASDSLCGFSLLITKLLDFPHELFLFAVFHLQWLKLLILWEMKGTLLKRLSLGPS